MGKWFKSGIMVFKGIFFFVFLPVLMLLNCVGNVPCDIAIAVPIFRLEITDQNLQDNPDSFKWYYRQNGVLIQDSFSVMEMTDTIPGEIIYQLQYGSAVDRSLSGIKTFFLKRSATSMDTIYYDVSTSNDPCTRYNINSFTYNGADALHNPVIVK